MQLIVFCKKLKQKGLPNSPISFIQSLTFYIDFNKDEYQHERT